MATPCVCDKMRRVTRGKSQGQGEDEEEAGGMLQMLQIYVGDTKWKAFKSLEKHSSQIYSFSF